jgi:hypothetical protein
VQYGFFFNAENHRKNSESTTIPTTCRGPRSNSFSTVKTFSEIRTLKPVSVRALVRATLKWRLRAARVDS